MSAWQPVLRDYEQSVNGRRRTLEPKQPWIARVVCLLKGAQRGGNIIGFDSAEHSSRRSWIFFGDVPFTVRHILFQQGPIMILIYSAFALALLVANAVHGQSQPNIYTATLGEGGARTAEISTEELRHILTEKSATVFDVRPTVHEI